MNTTDPSGIEDIKVAVENLRATLERQLARFEEQTLAASGDVYAQVEARKHAAKELKLDTKLVAIFEEVCYYPGWVSRGAKAADFLCEVQDPAGEKTDGVQKIHIGLGEHRYTLSYEDKGSSSLPDFDYFHHTKLSVFCESGIELITINISVDLDRFGTSLRPFGFEAFRPGLWMKDFLECFEKFEAKKKLRALTERYDSKKNSDLKSRFAVEEKRPNQAPEPTPLVVTPRAEPRVAPTKGVAHL
jgi:hypothetical protein